MKNNKIEESIATLQRAEKIALQLNPTDGLYLAFSGGKDSAVVYKLCQIAGVKFTAHYSVTGIDAPTNIQHIKRYYPTVAFEHPKENYFQLVEKKGLPMMHTRFCCSRLKENMGAGNVVIDGVRAEESANRAKYNEVMVRSRRVENVKKGRNRSFTEIEENEHRCIKGKDRIDVHPILRWTSAEVWEFMMENNIPLNPCYSYLTRVGCMYCPFASKEQLTIYEEEYPLYKKRLLLAIERFMTRKQIEGINTAADYYEWWKSKKTLKTWLQNR